MVLVSFRSASEGSAGPAPRSPPPGTPAQRRVNHHRRSPPFGSRPSGPSLPPHGARSAGGGPAAPRPSGARRGPGPPAPPAAPPPSRRAGALGGAKAPTVTARWRLRPAVPRPAPPARRRLGAAGLAGAPRPRSRHPRTLRWVAVPGDRGSTSA